jgi:hypothetical protein
VRVATCMNAPAHTYQLGNTRGHMPGDCQQHTVNTHNVSCQEGQPQGQAHTPHCSPASQGTQSGAPSFRPFIELLLLTQVKRCCLWCKLVAGPEAAAGAGGA